MYTLAKPGARQARVRRRRGALAGRRADRNELDFPLVVWAFARSFALREGERAGDHAANQS